MVMKVQATLSDKKVLNGYLPSTRNRLRRVLLNTHLAIALAVGVFFSVLGLTGSFIVFMPELEELDLPAVHPKTGSAMLTLDDILQTVKTRYPDKPGRWLLLLPGYGNDYVWAIYPKPKETADEFYAPFRVLIDPYSGQIAKANYWGQAFWTLVYEVHAAWLTGKLSPEIGQMGINFVSFLGVFMVITALTGLYLWWPKRGKFKTAVTIKRGASPERFYFDLHKTIGFYTAPILLIWGITGFSFSYADYLKPLIRCLSPISAAHLQEPKVKSVAASQTPPLTVAQAVAIADAVFPGAELREIATPADRDGVYRISKKQTGEANKHWPRSQVWIDQYSGNVLAVQDPNKFTAGETFMNLLLPLHSAEAFGLAGRIVWSAAGIAPLLLFVTGIVRWRQKHRAAKLKKANKFTSFNPKLDEHLGR